MTAHTPGPWHIKEPHINVLAIHDAAGGYVAELTTEGDEPPPLMHANARLIAAVPDMLAALIAANEKLHIICDGPREYAGGVPTQILFPMINAAIAKATGASTMGSDL